MREIRTIEAKIKQKIKEIKDGKITKKDSKIGMFFNRLKQLDEASYETLLKQYIEIEENEQNSN